jgi:hypothetical protein
MIIWSRWGILVLLFVGLGVLLGFALAGITGLAAPSGPINGVFIGLGFILSAGLLWVFTRFVVGTHIDKPQPAVLYEKLAEPVRDENNALRTHRVIPVLHPETGQQIMTRPVSTFFFVPIRYWPYVLGALGAIIFVINLVVVVTR